jgi:hypothetical protein
MIWVSSAINRAVRLSKRDFTDTANPVGKSFGIASAVWAKAVALELRISSNTVDTCCRVAIRSGHPQFVCHGLTELLRLKGSGLGIEKALGTRQQRAGRCGSPD